MVKIGEFTLELEVGELSDHLKEVARRELRETPERRKEACEELRKLLKGNENRTPRAAGSNLISIFS